MSERIDFGQLRRVADQYDGIGFPLDVRELDALLDVVEAARRLIDGPGGQPGLNNGRALAATLRRFRFDA